MRSASSTLTRPADYLRVINRALEPCKSSLYTALDLFAGCGGLSLGFEAAGFTTTGIEMREDACDTYNNNLNGVCINDKLTADYDFPDADILIAGPPCQPFSVNGKQLGKHDARDGFPIFLAAVKKIRPKMLVFENVAGLAKGNGAYLKHILGNIEEEGYTVEAKLFDLSEYGIPQKRHRLVAVGYQRGIFKFPDKIPFKINAGRGIGKLAYSAPEEYQLITRRMQTYIRKYERASKCANPRDLDLSKPARTLTCRNLSGATGDIVRLKMRNGRKRTLLVREAARLQSFPDWFEFYGAESEIFNQIGNAVPPYFAYQLALKVKEYLN